MHVGASPDTDVAATVKAAQSLTHCLFLRVSTLCRRHSCCFFYAIQLHGRTFCLALSCSSKRDATCHALHGHGCPSPLSSCARSRKDCITPSACNDPAVIPFLVHKTCCVTGISGNAEFPARGVHKNRFVRGHKLCQKPGIKTLHLKEGNLCAQFFPFCRRSVCRLPIKIGKPFFQRILWLSSVVHVHVKALCRQIVGAHKARNTSTYYSHALTLLANIRALQGSRNLAHQEALNLPHVERAAKALPKAHCFAGVIADMGKNAWQGKGSLHKPSCLARIALRKTGHDSADIEVEGTGHLAAGRVFLCAASFQGVHALLIKNDVHTVVSPKDSGCEKGGNGLSRSPHGIFCLRYAKGTTSALPQAPSRGRQADDGCVRRRHCRWR